MPGFQEILILIFVIFLIIFLPRIAGSKKKTVGKKKSMHLNGRMRMLVVLSVLWPVFISFIVEPWNNNLTVYFIYAFFPILILWSLIWIIDGFKKRK